MIILDTNVISEILRQEPNESVVDWFKSQPGDQLFTTAVTQVSMTNILDGDSAFGGQVS